MIIILMGVSGCGKTTVGTLLSEDLGWHLYDADDFHSQANIEKMKHSIPLTDEDRIPWLAALHQFILKLIEQGEDAIVACSALKEAYRDRLQSGGKSVRFVYLKGSYDFILGRLQQRKGHFMKPELLKSQFEALEEPHDALVVDILQGSSAIVAFIKQGLGL